MCSYLLQNSQINNSITIDYKKYQNSMEYWHNIKIHRKKTKKKPGQYPQKITTQ